MIKLTLLCHISYFSLLLFFRPNTKYIFLQDILTQIKINFFISNILDSTIFNVI